MGLWTMQTLLLTWWTGYIWSHAAVTFLEAGYNVILFDNLSNSSENVVEKIKEIVSRDSMPAIPTLKFYNWDLRNSSEVEQVFQENNIDWVIHFAWAKAVWESCDKPFYYYDNNVTGSNILFKVMESFWVRNIIFSSSATVYKPDLVPPFTEESDTWNTTNPYWTSKFIIENILRDLSNHKEWNVINLRYFNPVWAHKSGLIWEDPNDIPNNLLPYIMKVANWELESLWVFGDDYDTIDGTWVRDYIHVVDLVEGHLKAWQYIESPLLTREGDRGWVEVFNLWTGNGTSVMQMIDYTSEIIWNPLPYSIQARRTWDIASSYCIADKAKSLLDWESKISVKQAIQDSWNFIQKNREM